MFSSSMRSRDILEALHNSDLSGARGDHHRNKQTRYSCEEVYFTCWNCWAAWWKETWGDGFLPQCRAERRKFFPSLKFVGVQKGTAQKNKPLRDFKWRHLVWLKKNADQQSLGRVLGRLACFHSSLSSESIISSLCLFFFPLNVIESSLGNKKGRWCVEHRLFQDYNALLLCSSK